MAASIWLASASRDSTPGKSWSAPPSRTTGRVSPGGKSRSASPRRAASSAATTTCPASATTLLKALRRGKSKAWIATRSRPTGAGLPAASLMRGTFRNRRLHRNHLAAPDEANIRLSPDAVGTKISGDSSESIRRYSVNTQDDVARHNSCSRRRAVFDDRHDHQAAGLAGALAQRIGHGNRLQSDTKPAARDAAVLEQQRYDAFDGRGRNRNDPAAWPKGRHAQTRAGGIEDGPTLLALSEADIEHDAPVDQTAAAGMPFGAGEIDEPQPRAHATRPVCSDRERDGARMRLARRDRWRRQLVCRPQNRDIGAGIASGNPGRHDRAACPDKFKIIISRQRLLGGDDNTGPPHHARDMPPACKADSDDSVFRSLRARGQSA